MICYKDRSYCSASREMCFNESCYRFLSEAESKRAQELELLIDYCDFWVMCEEMIENAKR